MPKILYFITEDWYFCSHRLPLARSTIKAGYETVLLTNVQSHAESICSEGIKLIPLALRRQSLNPLRELITLLQVIKVYRAERPDVVHHVAMKPVVYGSIAASLARVPCVVNALAGMGYLFVSSRLKARILRAFITWFLGIYFKRKKTRVILQNPNDIDILLENGISTQDNIRLIRGSGVDVDKFVSRPEPSLPVKVILPSRMLFDKGVKEFVEAADILRRQGSNARFVLIGRSDHENPSAIPESQLECWQKDQVIEWWGHQADMPSIIANAHIVCLPSYREGLPKSLLEAASCGRPIVATDVPGCREIVRDGVNGLLVPAADPAALAKALHRLIEDKDLRQKMGNKGREIVKEEFTEEIIVNKTLAVYRELIEP